MNNFFVPSFPDNYHEQSLLSNKVVGKTVVEVAVTKQQLVMLDKLDYFVKSIIFIKY
ncbi:hypothetical protein ACWE42_18490 [Sutcliffiella cohnii]